LAASGLILVYEPDWQGKVDGFVVAQLSDGQETEARAVREDKETGFLLFEFADPELPLREQMRPAPIINPYDVRLGSEVEVRFNVGISQAQQGAKVMRLNSDLPGRKGGQTFWLAMQTETGVHGGVVFTPKGEAFALVARERGARQWLALGISEASQLIREYYDDMLEPGPGVGDKARLMP
jgi:hypothetical protein